LLDVHGPFESMEALQAALYAWREEYNTDRPHQSLGMAFPASRFTPASSPLELRIPAQLTASPGQPKLPPPALGSLSAPNLPAEPASQLGTAAGDGQPAVEVDRVVPASGNLWIGGQQVWLGPALSRRQITLWADAISLHVLLDGARIKTLVDGTFIWTPSHDQRPCSFSTALLHGCGRCRPGAAVHRWRPSGAAGGGDHGDGM